METEHPASPPDPRETRRPVQPPAWWQSVFIAVWLAGLVVALAVLWRYKQTPGPSATLQAAWPSPSRLTEDPAFPTLIMFAHPRCACTRASLADLRALIGPHTGRVVTIVAFMRPHDAAADWLETDTWSDASSIPGVRLVADEDGREAALFGAKTSGQVVLYDPQGHLLFSGGITPARGHVGASDQTRSLAALLQSETRGRIAMANAVRTAGSVYGCRLQEDKE